MTVQELDTIYGPMFVPDTDQGQYWWLANTGASPEDQYIQEICKLLDERPKGIAVDVGANFGCWTLPLAKHAHRVVAIEPQKPVYSLLVRSIFRGKHSNIDALNCAAGHEDGKILVPVVDLEKGTNFGGITLLEGVNEGEVTRLRRLDDVLGGYPVSFIKIDVEGFEDHVLEGARKTIERCQPILFVEMDHSLSNRKQLKERIESMGYLIDIWGGNYLGMPL